MSAAEDSHLSTRGPETVDRRGSAPEAAGAADLLELKGVDVFVTVGTDHHPFDRMTAWVDSWLSRRGDEVNVLIQYGTSLAPAVARGTDYLPRQHLDAVMRRTPVFVTHGGPATIAQCWELDSVPIVVPRNSALGEHVDDHQMRFAERMAAEGRVALAHDEAEFARLLDGRLSGERPAPPHRPEEVAKAVALLGTKIDALVAARRGRRTWRGGRT